MKKIIRAISKAITSLVLVCSLLVVCFLSGCDGSLTYESVALGQGTVGEEYSASVATASDTAATYALKSGSRLPSGLSLSREGGISGIPMETFSSDFTVVATSGNASAEAVFSLVVEEGTLVFSETEITVPLNKEITQKLSVSTLDISAKYTVTDGTMPAGTELNQDGTITGRATVLGSFSLTVTAAATYYRSVSVEITINVVEPWLEYNPENNQLTLASGRVRTFYSEQLPAATGVDEGESIFYSLKEGSSLPAGLELDEMGYIEGTPSEQVARHSFTVVASAEGYTSASATFNITIQAAGQSGSAEGFITFAEPELETAYVGETYAQNRVLSATASNRSSVTFALADDSDPLPAGFELLANGTVRARQAITAAVGEYRITVVASANNCDPVERTVTIVIAPAKLVFASMSLSGITVGESYSSSVANAMAPDGSAVNAQYALKEGYTMPSGLVFHSDGSITGTPAKSYKRTYVVVTANADGYSGVETEIYFVIRDGETVVSDGVFEAEYLDLNGITGAGWSGSAADENMVQEGSAYGASNGYFLGFTHMEQSYDFKIHSSTAVSGATLVVSLGSELGNISLTSAEFDVQVNGVSVNYGTISVTGDSTGTSMGAIRDYTITTSLALDEGDNVITLTVRSNYLMSGNRTGGPAIDCIKIENFGSAQLSWNPHLYNLDRFQA